MENIFFNDNFFNDLSELLEYEEIDKATIELKPDDYFIEVGVGELEPVVKLTPEGIAEYYFDTNDERFPFDDADEYLFMMEKILKENIDFERINSLMPKLYYDSGTVKIYKEELLNAF